jgi:16S rRNA (guanine966-N2)-methyltransferase
MRISGGIHRSRILASPRGSHTRPTSDRVREALFSVLSSRGSLAAAHVLDLYAGTGALGLEALSRGAEHVTFVESDRRALEVLARNIASLREGPRTRVMPAPAARALARLPAQPTFHLLLCDPPYADVPSGAAAAILSQARPLLVRSALVVLEHASRDPAPQCEGLRPVDTRVYGDTSLTLYEQELEPH